MSFQDEIKQTFTKGNIITRLLIINIAIFLIINIIGVFLYFGMVSDGTGIISDWLSVPTNIKSLLFKPWTIITYMFTHVDFMHILFNMLWLFWFGKIFLEFFSSRQLLGVYLLGGISGALLYIVAYNVAPVFSNYVEVSRALGASASVMAIVIATSYYQPNYGINLLFIGRIELKWIALVTIVLDISRIPYENAGGHIAHLGGALFGILFVTMFRKRINVTKGVCNFIDSVENLFKPKPKMRISYQKPKSDFQYNKEKSDRQKRIDEILDKISKYGYSNLTTEEKDYLFKNSSKY